MLGVLPRQAGHAFDAIPIAHQLGFRLFERLAFVTSVGIDAVTIGGTILVKGCLGVTWADSNSSRASKLPRRRDRSIRRSYCLPDRRPAPATASSRPTVPNSASAATPPAAALSPVSTGCAPSGPEIVAAPAVLSRSRSRVLLVILLSNLASEWITSSSTVKRACGCTTTGCRTIHERAETHVHAKRTSIG